MTINTIAFKTGATYPQTGGSAQATASAGVTLENQRIITTSESLVLQNTMDFGVTRPKANASAPNGYTQGRRRVFIKQPILLANGEYTVNTVSLELSADIETSDAQVTLLRDLAIQVLSLAETDSFWEDLNVS